MEKRRNYSVVFQRQGGMDHHLPGRGRGMRAQRTARWARCPDSLPVPRPGTAAAIHASTAAEVVAFLRYCFDEGADTAGDPGAGHLDTILSRARSVARRRRLRDAAALMTVLVAAALAGFYLGTAL